MVNGTQAYGKVIKVSEKTYDTLHGLKFGLKKDTFGEVIEELIEEHIKKQKASA